jgi:predicted transcriptional regulator
LRADFRVSAHVVSFFESTPARIDPLKRIGPCSTHALAKAARRNYSKVHGDIARLLDLGPVERADDNTLRIPFEAVEIHMALGRAV